MNFQDCIYIYNIIYNTCNVCTVYVYIYNVYIYIYHIVIHQQIGGYTPKQWSSWWWPFFEDLLGDLTKRHGVRTVSVRKAMHRITDGHRWWSLSDITPTGLMWRLPFHREADAFANLLWIDLVAMVWERVEIRGRLYWDVMGLYI